LTGTAIILFLSITLSFPKLLPSIRHQFDYLTLAVFVYQFLIGYLLLKGIHRENLKYIKAWIILQIFHILLVFSVFLFKCFNFEYDILDNILLVRSCDNNNVNSESIKTARIRNRLRTRTVCSELVSSAINNTVNRGTPQGGVISLLLWIVMINMILKPLEEDGVKVVDYAVCKMFKE
uniref:Uncharacterized protein n=1 Tax=Megaselia scalaris TaxID=36166 RepID=T1GXG1_MEGSC